MDRADRGDNLGLVEFVRYASLTDCGVLFCGLDAYVCTVSADRVTGADRADLVDIFKRKDGVKILAGVNGEESPETRERLVGRLERLPLRGRLSPDEPRVDATANGTPEDNWAG